MKVIVDSDDMADSDPKYNCLDLLLKFKKKFPKFKITLFTIPALSSDKLLDDLSQYRSWIEVAYHGWDHDDMKGNHEFAYLTKDEAKLKILKSMEKFGNRAVKGWKSPGWQISDGTYEVLKAYGFWVMDHPESVMRRPKGLKGLCLDDPRIYHTHTWDCMNNGIEYMLPKASFDQDTEFLFVSEAVK